MLYAFWVSIVAAWVDFPAAVAAGGHSSCVLCLISWQSISVRRTHHAFQLLTCQCVFFSPSLSSPISLSVARSLSLSLSLSLHISFCQWDKGAVLKNVNCNFPRYRRWIGHCTSKNSEAIETCLNGWIAKRVEEKGTCEFGAIDFSFSIVFLPMPPPFCSLSAPPKRK